MAKDYIPARDKDFNDWFKFLNQYVAQKSGGSTPARTHIPQAARTTLADAYAAWYTAYAATIGPHTPVDTEAENNAKTAAKAAVDEAMENVGAFFVFANGEYYKGMGVLPHEKGVFFIDGNNIEMKPTHMNKGILQNKLSWSKIGLGLASLYSEKTLPYTLNGDILKVVDVGMQQAYRKVDPFFSIDKKGNLKFDFK
jgi:hypothetical protein